MFDSNSFCSLALYFYREICQLPSDMSRTCLESKTTIILGLGMEIQFEKIWFFISISYYANFSNLPSKILTLAIFFIVLRKYINPDIWQFLTIALNWTSHFKAAILYSIGITFANSVILQVVSALSNAPLLLFSKALSLPAKYTKVDRCFEGVLMDSN